MTKTITAHAILTIGIDLGDRKSHLCVLDATGEIVEESQKRRPRRRFGLASRVFRRRASLSKSAATPPGFPNFSKSWGMR